MQNVSTASMAGVTTTPIVLGVCSFHSDVMQVLFAIYLLGLLIWIIKMVIECWRHNRLALAKRKKRLEAAANGNRPH